MLFLLQSSLKLGLFSRQLFLVPNAKQTVCRSMNKTKHLNSLEKLRDRGVIHDSTWTIGSLVTPAVFILSVKLTFFLVLPKVLRN